MLRKLLTHVSTYTFGNLLTTLVSLISFPILTRLFSVEEYGLLSLISTTLLLLVGLAKVGIQHSAVRFYAEYRARNDPAALETFYSTVLFGMLGFGMVVTLIWAVASQIIPANWWTDPRLPGLFLLTAALILVRTVDSSMINVLRAQERSGAYVIYTVLKKYIGLGLTLLILLFVARNLYGFYSATLLTEAVAVIALLVYMSRGSSYSPAKFSWTALSGMMVFGIPMVGYEVLGIVLQMGDRYVMQAYLGSEAIGLYSAAYNLCEYTGLVFVSSFLQAVQPMYVRTWEQQGAAETSLFVSRALHFYMMISAAVVAGLAATAKPLIGLLASSKFESGAVVVPMVAAGLMISGILPLAGAGIYVRKNSGKMMAMVGASAVVSLLLNLLLVPRFGIMGSAFSALGSYVFLAALAMVIGGRILPVTFPWLATIKFIVAAGLMYAVVVQIGFDNVLAELAARVVTGVILYAVLILALDREARSFARTAVQRFIRRQKSIEASS